MKEIKQQLKELIDKALVDIKTAEERTVILNDLINSIPKNGKTEVYCKCIGKKIVRIGIITHYQKQNTYKRYYSLTDEDDFIIG